LTETLARTRDIQPDDLVSMSRFFEDYYGSGDLGSKFLDLRAKYQFKTLADEFEMISSRMQDVFVPYGNGKKLIDELRHEKQLTAPLRTHLQRYTVGLQPWELRKAKETVLFALPGSDDSIWIASDAAYDRSKGLQVEVPADGIFG
jgi:hypothetical protein